MQCVYCSLELVTDTSVCLLSVCSPLHCGDITWFWLRQHVTRCRIIPPSFHWSYNWLCDHSRQLNEGGSFWVIKKKKKLSKRDSIYLYTTFVLLLPLPPPPQMLAHVENPICEYETTAMNLNAALRATEQKVGRCCITDDFTDSPNQLWAASSLGILFHFFNF